ncbi:hypothetical protein [Rossellomorea aquimaris]|uniref:YqgU-like 6-bladed beta-propeller domain-containing protein n=1 Tax=Rossellomorea aquimaris TaxID=189382 RepID=A0A1J6W340_9BACI|nr:hypothetical protein [Rossellomorea aquimaris]OIU71012.1 hypothetical protein BHE18_08145 [Rossellomorea aquimaris]
MKKLVFKLLLIILFLLTGCQSKIADTPQSDEQKPEKQEQLKVNGNSIPSETFIENINWLSNREILTVSDENGEASFYITDIFKGDSEKIYEIPSSYVHSMVSPDKSRILIHSASATYSAMITIIDLNGKEIYRGEIPSSELSYVWNAFNKDKLLITSFAEDWSFEVFELDLNSPELRLLDIEEPFLKWNSEVSVLYQDWNSEEISISAPLVSQNILDGKKETIDMKSIHFERFPRFLLSVHANGEKEDEFIYQFINENGGILSEFQSALLSRYSDWFIPFYDMIDDKDELITFKANEAGSLDTYTGTFSLKRWDVMGGSEETLMPDLAAEPIQCSPNGSHCLYGNQLEKIIDIDDASIVELVKEEG